MTFIIPASFHYLLIDKAYENSHCLALQESSSVRGKACIDWHFAKRFVWRITRDHLFNSALYDPLSPIDSVTKW